jgi:hypothetical protein
MAQESIMAWGHPAAANFMLKRWLGCAIQQCMLVSTVCLQPASSLQFCCSSRKCRIVCTCFLLRCLPACLSALYAHLLLPPGILLVWNVNGAFIIGIFFTMFASWAKFPQKQSEGGLVPDKVRGDCC